MRRDLAETLVGAAVLAVAVVFLFYINTVTGGTGAAHYELNATFPRADGLGAGSEVRLAGVRVGTVRSIRVDPDTYLAEARIEIQSDLLVPEDSSAEIRADGLLGGSFVAIVPGAEDAMLSEGESFAFTQGSVSLMDLIGRFIVNSGTE